MSTFTEIALHPGGIIACLMVGLLAGWLARLVMKGGYGIIGDMIVGLLGAVIGGLLYALIVAGKIEVWGSALVALRRGRARRPCRVALLQATEEAIGL